MAGLLQAIDLLRKRKIAAEALGRKEAIREKVQTASATLADLLKAGPVETIEQERVPAISPQRIGTTFGGQDISAETAGIPETTLPRVTTTPARETPEFREATVGLAEALGGEELFKFATKEPKVIEDVAGFKRFQETGERVFPGAKKEIKKSFKKFHGPDGKARFFNIQEEGKQDELIAAGFSAEKPTKPTVSNIKANALLKFTEGKRLTPQEQKIVDKELQGRESPADVKAKAKARWEAKIESFEAVLNRKATPAEKRRLFINDPFSLLGPVEGGSLAEERITVISPTGEEGDIPKSQLKQALSEGFKKK